MTDIDPDGCRTIERNGVVAPERVIVSDVRKLDYSALAPVDGLAFGFPCNDFSMIGERRGISGRHGDLYSFGVRGLGALDPMFFVAENVGGMASVNKSRDFFFKRIMADLEAAGRGYRVAKHLYRFEKYGVPQKRRRFVMVGFRSDLGMEFRHPRPNGRLRTAREALADIPDNASNNERMSQYPKVVERLMRIKPGQNAFTSDLPDHLRFKMRSKATISQIYRRLLPDEPAYTVTGSGGGGTYMHHWDEPRALTNRERARLQAFPDWYRFEGGRGSVRRQISMAVPPLGAKLVFEAVLESLMELVSPSRKSAAQGARWSRMSRLPVSRSRRSSHP